MKRVIFRVIATVAIFVAVIGFFGAGTAFADTVSATSANWAGYLAQNGSYTGVSGTFVMPAISYSSPLTANATWVGIGGRTTSDLIQAGVYEVADAQGAIYQAWYELLPDDSTPITLAVHPGDSISIAILETSQDTWNIVVNNNTTNQQFEKTVTYHSSLSSAEWIQERPEVNQTFAPLSGFTPVQFTGATAVQNGVRVNLSQTNAQQINLLDDPTYTALAVPSPIAIDGTSFSVFRTSATVSPATTTTTSPSQTTIPIPTQSQIPPYQFHRTGRGISWAFHFPIRR